MSILLIVPNKTAKQFVGYYITGDYICMTIDEVKNKKYKKYDISKVVFSQYELCKEVAGGSAALDGLLSEIKTYINKRRQS